jgi:hypothetical protein
MRYRLIIDPTAKLDIMETIQKQATKLIKKGPEMFQIRYKTLRMVPLEKFPFMILYQIDQAKKLVADAAVLHTSRNPKIWKERAK